MKSVSEVKRVKLAHLNWCLEKLKFRDTGIKEEDYEYLYRLIFEIVTKMNEMDDTEALDYCRQKFLDTNLVEKLQKYNIDWNC